MAPGFFYGALHPFSPRPRKVLSILFVRGGPFSLFPVPVLTDHCRLKRRPPIAAGVGVRGDNIQGGDSRYLLYPPSGTCSCWFLAFCPSFSSLFHLAIMGPTGPP